MLQISIIADFTFSIQSGVAKTRQSLCFEYAVFNNSLLYRHNMNWVKGLLVLFICSNFKQPFMQNYPNILTSPNRTTRQLRLAHSWLFISLGPSFAWSVMYSLIVLYLYLVTNVKICLLKKRGMGLTQGSDRPTLL